MNLPRWKNPGRKRILLISHKDLKYCKYYDLDVEDFTNLVNKLHNKEILTEQENNRYGIYLITMTYIVLENSKFRNKSMQERNEIADQINYELCIGLPCFNKDKGYSIYSYAYRIAYVAGCHYFTNKNREVKKEKIILDHCYEELQQYIDSISTHKVNTSNVNN